MVRVPAITLDTFLEFVKRQVIHEQGKHSLSGIHPSFFSNLANQIENSNQKMRFISYPVYYVRITSNMRILCGHLVIPPDIAVDGLGIGFVEAAAAAPLLAAQSFKLLKVQEWTIQRTWQFPWAKSLAPAMQSWGLLTKPKFKYV